MTADETAKKVAEISAGLMELSMSLGPLLEAVTGYREQARSSGFSPEAAEAMALVLHAHLMAKAFTAS